MQTDVGAAPTPPLKLLQQDSGWGNLVANNLFCLISASAMYGFKLTQNDGHR